MTRIALFLSLTSALVGCHSAPAPTAPATLPTLTRPVTTLTAAAAEQNVWIARDAVVVRNGIPGVYVLHDGRARFRMIRRGRNQDSRVQVVSGLRGDETLVLGNYAELHDGSPVVASIATKK